MYNSTMNNSLTALFLAGDRYHDPRDAFEGVAPILVGLGVGVETTTDPAHLDREALVGKSLLVLHRDGMEFSSGFEQPPLHWMQPHQEEAVEEFVRGGGNLLALHNSAWDYPWDGPYRRVLGGYYLTHPPLAKFQVRVVQKDHPVTHGVENYAVEDEQHWLWFDYDRVTLLLTNHGQDGRQSAAGWAYEYGLGRVVFLANGHTAAAHRHPEFMKLKYNAARWMLRLAED